MSKRDKIKTIRQLISNPPKVEPDLSKWTEEDLRWIIVTANKYDMKVIDPTQLNEDEKKVYIELIHKYY